jgi:hypothetical protein
MKKVLGNLPDYENTFTNQVRALLNAKVRDYIQQKGNTLTKLAMNCHVTPEHHLSMSTVSKLAYYETTRPAWTTIIAVAEALEILDEVALLMVAYARNRTQTPPSPPKGRHDPAKQGRVIIPGFRNVRHH